MGATIIKIKLPEETQEKKPLTPFRKKLLKGPAMTAEEVKEYEKRYPWLEKYKD